MNNLSTAMRVISHALDMLPGADNEDDLHTYVAILYMGVHKALGKVCNTSFEVPSVNGPEDYDYVIEFIKHLQLFRKTLRRLICNLDGFAGTTVDAGTMAEANNLTAIWKNLNSQARGLKIEL